MPDLPKCTQCGAPLAADVPGGQCLRCLLGLGLKRDDAADKDLPAPVGDDTFPGYRILGKIGEGGCGVVYRAAQNEPVRRDVAIKVIKLGMDTRMVITRFEAERQALALMDHPNIARVFDAGITGRGHPFFVMELVAGENITDYCDCKQLSVRQRLELFLQVCEAFRHAHLKGIIHRDIKPSNILVAETDGAPVPKVIDFGVAKAMDHHRLADRTIYTAFDQFVGTPAYMSPEQAGLTGEDIDARSDIYSLGVLLYELLTGHPPFEPSRLRQAAIHEICRIIREEDPSLPSARLTTLGEAELTATARHRLMPAKRLVNYLRGDLDGIVMKALDKNRDGRYDSAAELAADIIRHLRYEPVSARSPGALYRFRKFARRNKLAILTGFFVIASLLSGLTVSSWMYLKEKRSRQVLEQRAYFADMNAAARSAVIRVGGLAGAVKLLDNWEKHNPDLRRWEWYYLNGLCHHELLTIQADAEGLWSVTWSPDGNHLATGGEDGEVKIWDAATGKAISSWPGHTGPVRIVAWSPDGKWLASSGQDASIRIRDVGGGDSHAISQTTTSLAWSPGGRWLATGSPDGNVRILNPFTGMTSRTLSAGKPVNAVCWSGDGGCLFACGQGGMTRAWDSANGRELWNSRRDYHSELMAAACSPDGRELVTGGMQNAVNFFNASTGDALVSLFDNQNVVLSLSWSFDGSLLASSTRGDGRIAIRETRGGGRITRDFRGHLGSVRSIAWQPGTHRLASASADGTVKIWDVIGRNPSIRTLLQPDQAIALDWSPDSSRLAVGTRRSHAWVRDFNHDGAPVAMDGGYTEWSFAVAWNPDGTLLASAGRDGLVVFDPETRLPVWKDLETFKDLRSLAWNPEGTRLAAVNKARQLNIWDSSCGKPWKSINLPPGITGALAWSPDGRTIAAGAHHAIHLFDATLQPLRILPGHPEGIACLAWSPDGTRLASAGGDTSVKIWNPHDGSLLFTLLGHGAPVHGLAWSPDGSRLATGSWDLTLKIWDTASGIEVCSFDKPAGIIQMIESVAWSPDGMRIAISDIEGCIGILDANPGWDARAKSMPPMTEPDSKAIAETTRSLRLYCNTVEPSANDDADALRRLAWILATAPYSDVRNGKKAVVFAERANQLVGGANSNILNILAAAYAETGDFEKAITTQQQAISLLRKGGESQSPYAAALKLYESHQPFRDDSW